MVRRLLVLLGIVFLTGVGFIRDTPNASAATPVDACFTTQTDTMDTNPNAV